MSLHIANIWKSAAESNSWPRSGRIDNKLNNLLDYDNGALAKSLKRATYHYEFCGLADRIRGLFMDHGFVDATPVPKVIDTLIIFLD